MITSRWRVLVLGAGAAVLCSCTATSGSGTKDSTATDVNVTTAANVTTPPTTPPTPPPPPSPAPVDPSVRAKASVLTAADVPDGWRYGRQDTRFTTFPERLRRCLGTAAAAADPISVDASSGYYLENENADSAASVFADEKSKQTIVDVLGTGTFRRCYGAEITRALTSTFPRGTPLDVQRVEVNGVQGARSGLVASGRVVYDYTTVGYHGTSYVDLAFVAGDRFLTVVTVSKAGKRVSAATRNMIFGAVVRRAAG